MDGSQRREVDAFKGVVALGTNFSCTGTGDNVTVEDQTYAVSVWMASVEQAVEEIGAGVGNIHIDWFLCAGDNDRLRRVLDQIGQSSCGVSHGIGTVADNKTVVVCIVVLDGFHDGQPVFRLNVGTVDVQNLNGIDGAEFTSFWNIAQQLFRGDFWGQTLFGGFGSDGTAGCDEKNLFHISIELPSYN